MGGWMHVRVVDGHDVVGMETGRMRIGVVEHGVCEPKASVVRSTRMGKRMGRRGFMCCMGVWEIGGCESGVMSQDSILDSTTRLCLGVWVVGATVVSGWQ